MVELKDGMTLNGLLTACDTWMNLTLQEVYQTSSDAEHFVRLTEVFVRGTNIRYLRLPEEILDHIKRQELLSPTAPGPAKPIRGARGDRARGGGHRGANRRTRGV